MNGKNRKLPATLVLFALILLSGIALMRSIHSYADERWKSYGLYLTGGVLTLYMLMEMTGFIRYFSLTRKSNPTPSHNWATTLALLNEQKAEIKTWDLRNKSGLIIGRGGEADIDLSDTEYYAKISNPHAVLNYAGGSWYLSDAGSKHGTGVMKKGSGKKRLLAPGESVPVGRGDLIDIAEGTMLVIR